RCTASILLGNGNGTFSGATQYIVGSTPTSVAIDTGTKDVVASNFGSGTITVLGNSQATPVNGPTITAFAPTSGTIGTTVTITGTNFSGTDTVTFGGGV